jgi:hypothetical protein
MVYESASEFEKHMNRGDIVDYSLYLQNPSKYEDHLHSMATNGVCVDELVALHDEDLTLEIIMNGYGQKYYEEWAKTGNQIIQFAMALMDCCPEILINSPYGEVRLEVAKEHPEYTSLVMDKVVNEKSEWYELQQLFMTQKYPDPQLLKRFFRYKKPGGNNLDILKSKYKVSLMTPNAAEETMTDYQLFQSGNVLWKRNISGYGIWSIKYAQKQLKKNHQLTQEDFDYLKGQKKRNWFEIDDYLKEQSERFTLEGCLSKRNFRRGWVEEGD